jgi:hypothetical protein
MQSPTRDGDIQLEVPHLDPRRRVGEIQYGNNTFPALSPRDAPYWKQVSLNQNVATVGCG